MLTRRRLLQTTASVAAAPAMRAFAVPQPHSSLPPSIAALKSMRAQVKPITTEERRGRLERAQQLMRENKIDGILLAGGTSLTYFTGMRWGNSERLFAALIPASGKSICVLPSFENARAHEQLNSGPLENAEVLT